MLTPATGAGPRRAGEEKAAMQTAQPGGATAMLTPTSSAMPDAARLRIPARARARRVDRLALTLEALIIARLKARLMASRAVRVLVRGTPAAYARARGRMARLERIEQARFAAWTTLADRSALADVTEARGRLRGILGELLGIRP